VEWIADEVLSRRVRTGVAEIARTAGNVPKAARRLGVRVSKLRTVMDDVQANARRIDFERETAQAFGFGTC
jgi:hypothetical protein